MPEFDEKALSKVLRDKEFKRIQTDEMFLGFNNYLVKQEEERQRAEKRSQNQSLDEKINDLYINAGYEEQEQSILSVDKHRTDELNFRDTLPLAERYFKMKATVKTVTAEDIKSMTFDQAVEWAMSSVVVDGASDMFKRFVKRMSTYKDRIKAIEDKYKPLETDSKEQKLYKEACISGCKQQLMFDLNTSAELYLIKTDGHKFTKKGKARETLARHIVSIISGANAMEKANLFDNDSQYIHDQIARMSVNATASLQRDVLKEDGGLRKLCDQYKLHQRHQEKCFYDWSNDNFAQREKDRKKVNAAMDEYCKNENVEPLYAIMDKRLSEIMNFTFTESFFDKKWITDNVDQVMKFQAMAQRAGDLFSSTSRIITPVCEGYMNRMKDTNEEYYNLVLKKTNAINTVWLSYQIWFEYNIGVRVQNTMHQSMKYKNADVNEYTDEVRLQGRDEEEIKTSKANTLKKLIKSTGELSASSAKEAIKLSSADMEELLKKKYSVKKLSKAGSK